MTLKSADKITDKDGSRYLRVMFPFCKDTISQIKSINGHKWYPEQKYWTIPLSLDNALLLKKWGFAFTQQLKNWTDKRRKRLQNPSNITKIPGLLGSLFPYQYEGVNFIENKEGRALIGDEMGLGKTIQAIAWMQLHREKIPVIIICPSFLKYNWAEEINKWLPNPSLKILKGMKPSTDELLDTDIFLINYEILPNKQEKIINKKGEEKMIDIPYTGWVDFLRDISPQLLILDEVHKIKNKKARRTIATKKLGRIANNLIALSGTPIENRPLEIYNTVSLIDNSIFANEWSFKHRYCGAKHNGFGWDFSGASNVEELHEILTSKVMIRRRKKDVLKDLPDKIYSFVPLEINNRTEYIKAENDFIQYVQDNVEQKLRSELSKFMGKESMDIIQFKDHKLARLKKKEASKATALSQIEALKQLAVKGKIKTIVDWVESFLESGQKIILFINHKFVMDFLMEYFSKIAVKIDGSISMQARQRAVEMFQNNSNIKIFIGNIKAAGVGITLTEAHNIAFIEYPWTPGELVQAMDRAHRIGQKNTVMVHYLIALDTIEEKIIHLLDEKQKVLDAVLNGNASEDKNILTELINSYKIRTKE